MNSFPISSFDPVIPPHSAEAEQAVLGALLLDNTRWDSIADMLSADDFYLAEHRLMFRRIAELISQSKPADVITVCESLNQGNQTEKTSQLSYLNAIVQNTPFVSNILHYTGIVRNKSTLRQLIGACNEILTQAFSKADDIETVLSEAESRIFGIAQKRLRHQKDFQELPVFLAEAINRIETMLEQTDNPNTIMSVSTGFSELDEITAGLSAGDLVIVAARPSMGKTAFAINIGEHVAIHEKRPVGIFSLEMSGAQLAMRMIGSIGRINQSRLRTGKLIEDDWPLFTNAIIHLNEAPIFIDETSDLSIKELRSRARRLARQCENLEKGKLALVIVDYLQLMSGDTDFRRGAENRTNEIATISRGLKAMAKELNCPVVVLSQLNRAIEKRENKRPLMSDLRDSGAIEQDADLILFLHRDDYENTNASSHGNADIIIGKHRNGEIGKVELFFQKQYTKFENR